MKYLLLHACPVAKHREEEFTQTHAPILSCSRIAREIRRRRRRSQRKNASALSSSVRRRAIPGAQSRDE